MHQALTQLRTVDPEKSLLWNPGPGPSSPSGTHVQPVHYLVSWRWGWTLVGILQQGFFPGWLLPVLLTSGALNNPVLIYTVIKNKTRSFVRPYFRMQLYCGTLHLLGHPAICFPKKCNAVLQIFFLQVWKSINMCIHGQPFHWFTCFQAEYWKNCSTGQNTAASRSYRADS